MAVAKFEGRTRPSAPTIDVGADRPVGPSLHRCAFCGGSGRDPFGLLSPLALCGVCQGKGQVKLEEPVVECAFCSGTGVYPLGNRLTCTACGGKGVLTVAEPTITCPQCHGTGQDPESGSDLYCLNCRGAGLVATAPSTPVSSPPSKKADPSSRWTDCKLQVSRGSKHRSPQLTTRNPQLTTRVKR